MDSCKEQSYKKVPYLPLTFSQDVSTTIHTCGEGARKNPICKSDMEFLSMEFLYFN